jgi:uncharacterized protein YegL
MNNTKTKRKNEQRPRWQWWLMGCVGMIGMGLAGFLGGFLAISMLVGVPNPEARATDFFPTAVPYQVQTASAPPLRDEELGLDATARLDLVFVLDTTGSMSDELAQLQNNILYISEQIANTNPNVSVRYAFVAYKDRGDSYTTDKLDFTQDVMTFQANLARLSASGGGDTPEALEEALTMALDGLAWRDENTIKLMFVVTDASPQLIYNDDVPYTSSILQAMQMGIKIHTIASSGLEPAGEYILRQLSQATLGRFIFLTYASPVVGATSPPGDYRPDLNVGEPSTGNQNGDYTVEQLDELVLRLITDELGYVLQKQ